MGKENTFNKCGNGISEWGEKNLNCSLTSQAKVSLEIRVEAGESWEGRGTSVALMVVMVSCVCTYPRIH